MTASPPTAIANRAVRARWGRSGTAPWRRAEPADLGACWGDRWCGPGGWTTAARSSV